MDYQKMWFQMKKYIQSKNYHGKNELLQHMTDQEILASAPAIPLVMKGQETLYDFHGDVSRTPPVMCESTAMAHAIAPATHGHCNQPGVNLTGGDKAPW